MASHVVDKALEEARSYLAVLSLVTLLGKHLVSREALVEGQRRFQGHGREEQEDGGASFLLSPAVLSEGQRRVRRSPRRKGTSETKGFKRRL